MKLDQSIEARLRELEEINKEIRGIRDVQEQEEAMNQQNYYNLLAAKMAKSKTQYQTLQSQQKAKSYNDVAVNRYRAQHAEVEQANRTLDETRNKNMMIEEVLMRIKEQNPDLEQILNNMVGW